MLVPEAGSHRQKAVEAVRAQLIDLPVDLAAEEAAVPTDLQLRETEARRIAAKYGARMVFFADSGEEDRIILYVSDSSGDRTLVRRIDTERESMDARVEAMAVIVRATVQTLVDGKSNQNGAKTEEAAAPEALESKEQVSPEDKKLGESPVLGLIAAYGLGMHGEDALAVHGARLALMAYFGEFFRLVAGYRFEMPVTVSRYDVRTTVFSHPIEIGGAVNFAWRRLDLRVGVAALVDIVTWQVRPEREGISPRSEHTATRIAVCPNIEFDFPLTPIFSIFLGVSADISISQRYFSVQVEDGSLTIYDPWLIRPYFQAGFTLVLI